MSKAEWMSGKYGIMVHFLSHIASRDKVKKLTPNEMADNFDVIRFVDEIEAMGASWVIFPFGQNTGFWWSENPFLEKYAPGSCSKRDLFVELADELVSRNIRLIAYFDSDMDEQGEEIRKAFAWDESADKKEFMRRYTPAMRYYAEKLGDRISGWWFDGCYNSAEKNHTRTHDWTNDRFNKEEWLGAAKAGNKDAVIAMCTGANLMQCVWWDDEEYLPGEAMDLLRYPWDYDSEEKQWHVLTFIDCFWLLVEGMEMPDPRYSDEDLFSYVKACLEKKGAVTLNIGIYEDGTLADKSQAQVLRMKDFLKDELKQQ